MTRCDHYTMPRTYASDGRRCKRTATHAVVQRNQFGTRARNYCTQHTHEAYDIVRMTKIKEER